MVMGARLMATRFVLLLATGAGIMVWAAYDSLLGLGVALAMAGILYLLETY